MNAKFTGNLDDFKEKLSSIENDGEWIVLSSNQIQFKYKKEGVLNWYPSTGTINFQGKGNARQELEQKVLELLGYQVTGKENTADEEINHPDETKFHSKSPFLGNKFSDSEIVTGLVGAVGTKFNTVIEELKDRLKVIGYTTQEIKISRDIIPQVSAAAELSNKDEYCRISTYMTAGDKARDLSHDCSILVLGAAEFIHKQRELSDEHETFERRAYIINSLKHPDEVMRLREIYPEAFYLIGVYSDPGRRRNNLTEEKRLSPDQADELMQRDEDEHIPYGQRTSDTYHLSDFFIHEDGDRDKLQKSIWRILDILFGNPYITPTFDEYAMFMAFSASLRSADLSRQVGAVVASSKKEIIATGANDCPKYGGGLYWAEFDRESKEIKDTKDGRDYQRGFDSNKKEKEKIIDDIIALSTLLLPELCEWFTLNRIQKVRRLISIQIP